MTVPPESRPPSDDPSTVPPGGAPAPRRGRFRLPFRRGGAGAARVDACAAVAREALETEHARLVRGTGLHRLHWCIIAASSVLTLAAWQHVDHLVESRAEDRFERESERLLDALVERFERYENLLRACAATLRAHGAPMSIERWRVFHEELDLAERYPTISTMAFAVPVRGREVGAFAALERLSRPHFEVRPARDPADAEPALVITRIEPEASMGHALGLDLLHEPRRATAARAARDSGEPRFTAPLSLVRRSSRSAGLLLMVPVYERRGAAASGPAGRRAAFAGMLVAPFALHELASGPLERGWRQVGMRIEDDGHALVDELGASAPGVDPDPLHADAFELDMYGRTWRVEIASDLGFRAEAGLGAPRAVLASGIGIDVALFALFASLAGRNRRALACADRAVDEMHGHMTELAESNAELESFAHIVSHDLKTPVRGIGGLVEFLAEDLEAHLGSLEAVPEIASHLARLDEQQRRLIHLIDSVLAYSALGREHAAFETLDASGCVEALARELELDDGRLALSGERAVFRTQAVRFEQVMRNLLENAAKHFEGDPAALRIEVRSDPVPGGWTFAVEDNGPGIDERYHEAVFEVFRRLRSKDEVEGSGVGLSVVKRSVETVGGAVTLRSAPGRGCRFELFWPAGEPARAARPVPGGADAAAPSVAALAA